MISNTIFAANELAVGYDSLDYYAPEPFNKCRGCNRNLASNDPASQYQRQKIIQNTVRVPASLYTDNLGALNVYERPEPLLRVNWKQMSDRRRPSLQTTYVPTWGSSTKHSITRNRPGAMSPGGLGVDMKHNSYHRYLSRIKGKAPLRRGVIPPGFGSPYIPFDRAFPVYGGKTVKTSIVNNCNCPQGPREDGIIEDELLYKSYLPDAIQAVVYEFRKGDFVFAIKDADKYGPYYKAIILDEVEGLFKIEFEDDGTINYKTRLELMIFFDCRSCITGAIEIYDLLSETYIETNKVNPICEILGQLSNGQESADILNYIDEKLRAQLYPNIYSNIII